MNKAIINKDKAKELLSRDINYEPLSAIEEEQLLRYFFFQKNYREAKNRLNFHVNFDNLDNTQKQVFKYFDFICTFKVDFFDIVDRFDKYFYLFDSLEFEAETVNLKKEIVKEILLDFLKMVENDLLDKSLIDFLYKFNSHLKNRNIYVTSHFNDTINTINNNYFNKLKKLKVENIELINYDESKETIVVEEDILENKNDFDLSDIKVIVLGYSNKGLKKGAIIDQFKLNNFNINNIEIVNYEDVGKKRADHLVMDFTIDYILIGPTPHSGKRIGTESSIAEYIKKNVMKPDSAIELKDSNGVYKITKNNLNNAIDRIKSHYYLATVKGNNKLWWRYF